MGFEYEVFDDDAYAARAADRIVEALPGGGALVLTGGGTAKAIYPHLAGARKDWSGVEIAYSDERCVPPDHAESNYGMTKRLFLDAAQPGRVYRAEGELPPEEGAARYADAIRPLAARGFDLMLLGMGEDAHIGAVVPGSPALEVKEPAAWVNRPDGMQGITMTPPAFLSARRILLVVTGANKAETVKRAIAGDEAPADAPVRLLADHPDVTFLLDRSAASVL